MVALTYYFYKNINYEKNIWTRLASVIFGLYGIISIFQVNVYEEQLQRLPVLLMLIKLLVIFFGIYFFVNYSLSWLYKKIDNLELKKNNKYTGKHIFIVSFIFLLIMYLPVWLMEYPSNVSPDTLSQVKQILSGEYINHHPFAHTMWLKALMMFSKDLNIRIGIAALLQMIINALAFSYVSTFIYKKSKSLLLTVISTLFYGLLSFNAFYSITLIKDVTHAVICCLLTVLIIDYFDSEQNRNIKLGLIFIVLVLFCLFRSNGYYACILVFLISLILNIENKEYRLSAVILLSIIVSAIVKGPIYSALGVGNASPAEMLSIPLQQIALTIKNGCYLKENELALLNKVIDVSKVPDAYDVFLSDPIKNLLNEHGNIDYLLNNKFEYLKLWISIGIRNPIVYIRAWVNQISMLFSPYYYSTSIFWEVTPNNIGIVGTPLLINGGLNETLHMLAYKQHNISLIGWFHYQSITTWIMTVSAFYLLRKKNNTTIIVFALYFSVLFTLCISSPYNACFRYFYGVIVCLPLMLLMVLGKDCKENE